MDELLAVLRVDPIARRNRRLAALLAPAVVVAIGAFGAHQHRRLQMCSGAEARLAGVWDSPRKSKVHGAEAGLGRREAGAEHLERALVIFERSSPGGPSVARKRDRVDAWLRARGVSGARGTLRTLVVIRSALPGAAPSQTGKDMAYVPTLEPECAPNEVVEIYREFQRRMGFPAAPNFIKTQGHSSAAARGTWGLVQSVLVGGLLPRTLKEMMFVAISQSRKCRYCEAAHLACCRMLGVEPSALEKLVADVADISPAKVRDIVLFGLKCARDPQGLADVDFETLRRHGLRQSEIMEVISMAALAVYANIIADATGMAADEMFTQF